MWRFLKKKGIEKTAEKTQPAEIKPTAVTAAVKSDLPNRARRVLLKPLVSEKSSKDSIYDTYGFVAERGANKIEIAKAFWALYNVRPLAVRTLLMPEKRKKTGRVRGIRPVWKKALVRVPKGSKVEIFKGV